MRERFQGKEYDPQTGWHDFHARQYDASLGRWFSTDPAGQFASPYLAMGNIPTMGVDPDGQFAWFIPIIIGAVIGGTSQGIAAANNGGTFFGIDDLIVSAVGFVYGYVSSGIKTGNWGAKSLLQGGINAALFEVGYLTAGGGLAASAAAGAGGFGTTAAAGSFLASSAVNIAASSLLPPIPIYQSKNFSLSVSPTFSLKGGLGASIQADYTRGDFTFSAGAGINGAQRGFGGGVNYFNGHGGVGYSLYSYGGSEKQRLGELNVTAYGGDASFRISNDFFPGADGGDKFRTAAAQISYMQYSAGILLHTGDPNGSDGNRSIDYNAGGKGGQYNGGTANSTSARAGVAYFGYNNYRIGWSSDGIRHVFQNKLIHDGLLGLFGRPSPWFSRYRRPDVPSSPYFDVNANNPFSLWGY